MPRTIPSLLALLLAGLAFSPTMPGQGRGAAAPSSDQGPLFTYCPPGSAQAEQLSWELQNFRLPTTGELSARQLSRHTALRSRKPDFTVYCFLEFRGRLLYAGCFRHPSQEQLLRVPLHYECPHWFIITADGHAAFKQLEFAGRQYARLRLARPAEIRQLIFSLHLLPHVTLHLPFRWVDSARDIEQHYA